MCCVSGLFAAPRWYNSNAAGMALDPAFSRLALRGKYALSVEQVFTADLPGLLLEFYDASWEIELHTLYENGEETRRQWLFKDEQGRTRLVAAFSTDPAAYPEENFDDGDGASAEGDAAKGAADGAESGAAAVGLPAGPKDGSAATGASAGPVTALTTSGTAGSPGTAGSAASNDGAAGASASAGISAEPGDNAESEAAVTAEPEEPAPEKVDYAGFIELYNQDGFITEDHQLSSDRTDRIVTYFYNNNVLVRSETRMKYPQTETEAEKTESYCTDFYRYSRSSSLRAVERVYHLAADQRSGAAEPVRLSFPHIVLGAAKNNQFVSPAAAFSSDFFQDILTDTVSRVLYTTDDRGRVLSETRRDEAGEVIGELVNTWSGDRLSQVRWKAGDDDRLTEYEYDGEGDRILERNYNKGVLERTVRREGEMEVEELYMDGQPVLRAVWDNGRKISEERIHSTGTLPSAPDGSQTESGASQ
ncbi:hypothetical protein AGMMS49991_00920 [Spirochaetia bacterium]|nr:hypothetical protein AGMMS49991_00920 [Spirochaetia bacterium]